MQGAQISLLKISSNGNDADLDIIKRTKDTINPDEVYTYFVSSANRTMAVNLKFGNISSTDLTPKGAPQAALEALQSL